MKFEQKKKKQQPVCITANTTSILNMALKTNRKNSNRSLPLTRGKWVAGKHTYTYTIFCIHMNLYSNELKASKPHTANNRPTIISILICQ